MYNDFENYINKLFKLSYDNIVNELNNGEYSNINQDFIYKLWYKNNHKYCFKISNMIGKAFGLYDFTNEYSNINNTTLNNIDFKSIDNQLKNKGYYILKNKIKEDNCNKIINQIENYNNCYRQKNNLNWINSQDYIAKIPEVMDIATDPLLLQIAQNYLGCNPILDQTNFWISKESNVIDQTQIFHQDYDDIIFLKIFIYLNDVGEDNGPHSYISNSLNNMKEPYGYEPSQRLKNSFVNKNYKNDIITHLGKKGTIIIEDTRGYHKGSPVKKGVRNMLQLQYCATCLPFQQGNKFSKLKKNKFMKRYPICFLKYSD